MKKNKKIIFYLLILIGLSLTLTTVSTAYTRKKDDKKKIVLIDPGHGGIDGGAVSQNGTIEKHINLSIGIKLKDELSKLGYKVIMTREEDKGLYSDNGTVRQKKVEDLNKRCEMREKSKCDIFISIHLNTFPQSKYYGAQVWYSDNEESHKLASILQNNFRKYVDEENKRQEKPAKGQYKILRDDNNIPSVIVECGFISNPKEEEKLKDEEYQKLIAETIGKSVDDYFKNK
ncbi:N-acetylmuramoyl-L-alanine amidase CwlD [Clostridium cochlearium]|uniref:N-acetylmuramoyl-L-alanine amidase CwlD n=1 Tax=Clostridium cochlearium TaxID=1494 RepID=UPI001EE10AB0|nr:N-acetylmuramoyl-L-alanine amidase CwlD [Clostridium cochlearium]MBV1817593.1 N-acetylmuramoyl-L-alanine amidase CwlD [Bacteroidales bacterium MSK.15.36]MCG4572019.1 N-acetylmuramoyl-L-alanine amidase CwlD [Clostridium cochlearium]MCR1971129.1 N-acetylmuramoyl-L-alanine amidase CwlD [Clostridium cochlearium]